MNNYLQNLHTHSIYCDGIDQPEELIRQAISLGFDTIGFSGHSYFYASKYMREKGDKTQEYIAEINRLKKIYENQIRVLCGLEFEMFSECDLTPFDYVIGSSHYLKIEKELVGFDRTAECVEEIIQKYFHGDGLQYALAYYEGLTHLHEYGTFDIIGHFDLVAKFCETHSFFDVESKAYRFAALESLHAVAEHCKVFEVNTGAMARGYRTTPYPAPFLMKEIKAIGGAVILTSDCHDRNCLNYAYDSTLDYIRQCGFDEVHVLTKNGFEGRKL